MVIWVAVSLYLTTLFWPLTATSLFPRELLLTEYFHFFQPFSVNPKNKCVRKIPVWSAVFKIWHQQSCHAQSHLIILSLRHLTGWSDPCVSVQLNRGPNKVYGECTLVHPDIVLKHFECSRRVEKYYKNQSIYQLLPSATFYLLL